MSVPFQIETEPPTCDEPGFVKEMPAPGIAKLPPLAHGEIALPPAAPPDPQGSASPTVRLNDVR